jgi:hypothetical protein
MSFDPNCPHCNGAKHLTDQALGRRMPPEEAIRTALLTGIVVERSKLGDAPACEACQRAIDAITSSITRAEEIFKNLSTEAASGPPR